MTEDEIEDHFNWIQKLKSENETFYSSAQKRKNFSKNYLLCGETKANAKGLTDHFDINENLSETTSKTDYKLELIYNELDSEYDLLKKYHF